MGANGGQVDEQRGRPVGNSADQRLGRIKAREMLFWSVLRI